MIWLQLKHNFIRKKQKSRFKTDLPKIFRKKENFSRILKNVLAKPKIEGYIQ